MVVDVHLLAAWGVRAAHQERVAILLPNLDFNPLVKLVLQCWNLHSALVSCALYVAFECGLTFDMSGTQRQNAHGPE